MLLTLIKKRTTRRGIRAVLIEKNHLFGDKRLAEVYIPPDDDMPDLIYPVTITLSGIHLRGHRVRWLWKSARQRRSVEAYLREIQSSREEIRLELIRFSPY